MSEATPLRSVLYMPGANARALEKAKTLPADALILDLEDAVAPDAKAAARAQVVAAVKDGGYGARTVVVRVNALDTPWGEDDIAAAAEVGPDAILVPKVSRAGDIMAAEGEIRRHAAGKDVALWAMMETPLAMLHAEEIASSARDGAGMLSCFVMGTNDLAKDTGASLEGARIGMQAWLSTCVAAAASAGIAIVDGVYNDFKDTDGLEVECLQGRRFGMRGKTLIHPGQIEVANRVFAPSEDEVAWARKVIAAFELPENAGLGVVTVEGKMVELLHAEMARRTVAVADAIAARSAA